MRFRLIEQQSTCGRCHDGICRDGFCWCANNRHPIASIADKFPSPVCDSSDGSLWREEVDILRVIYDAQSKGEESPLVKDRGYCQETETYMVSWYWAHCGVKFPRQWDGPVIRLWSRLMLRPVRCAGGYTWIVLSDDAMEAIAALPDSVGRYHLFGPGLRAAAERAKAEATNV